MSDHQERTPSALAHGPVKSSDIERVRRDIGKIEVRIARDERASAVDRLRRIRARDVALTLGSHNLREDHNSAANASDTHETTSPMSHP